MIKLKQAVIVEGKYDKIKLSNIVDALIIETDGFSIFKDREKQRLIKRLAREKGILILTDSDSAGFKIRAFLGGSVPENRVFHAYIPDILGKEKRKTEPSKEGKLGVEGIPSQIIIEALSKAGVLYDTNSEEKTRLITNIDLYENGLSGRESSRPKREKLLEFLCLPKRLSTKSFVKVLNTFMTYDDFVKSIRECFGEEDNV